MLSRSRTFVGLLCGWLVLTSVGCATLRLPFGKAHNVKADAHNPVTQILCIWEQAEGRDPKGMPCRGFAGQILFLANRGSLPVEVDGDVRIYEFDDQGTDEEQTKPVHTFDFDSGGWTIHLINTSLGPTYNVFIPYMRHGREEANCALRLRLKSKDYPVVFSDLCSIKLSGRKKKSDVEPTFGPHDASDPPSADAAAIEAAVEALRRTTTISLNGDTSAPSPKKPTSGGIQLAAHEEGAEVGDPNAGRIRQLEALVQQLMDQQSGNTRDREGDSRKPAAPLPVDDSAKPLTKSSAGGQRFTLAKSTDSPPADRNAVEQNARSPRTAERAVATEAPRRSGRTAAPHVLHLLDELDEDGAAPLRHPLAELDGESTDGGAKARRQPQPVVRRRNDDTEPRVFPATERSPNSEANVNDPFDPIDTEAMETTAVESDQAVRRRLRAATR